MEIGGKPSAGPWWRIPAICCGKDATYYKNVADSAAVINVHTGATKCHSCGDNKALWAAVWRGVRPETGNTPPPEPDYAAPSAPPNTPLEGLTLAHCEQYLHDINTSMGGTIKYRNKDGREAKHHRYLDANGHKQVRNLNMKGGGWYPREFGRDILHATTVIVCEGEKDAARSAFVHGVPAFALMGGAGRTADVDLQLIVDAANRRESAIVVCADHDAHGAGERRSRR